MGLPIVPPCLTKIGIKSASENLVDGQTFDVPVERLAQLFGRELWAAVAQKTQNKGDTNADK